MKAIVNAEGLERAKQELGEVALGLYTCYQKTQGYISAIEQAGWRDAHFKDLKANINKANEYILPLKQFMVYSQEFMEKQKQIVERYKNIQFPKLR